MFSSSVVFTQVRRAASAAAPVLLQEALLQRLLLLWFGMSVIGQLWGWPLLLLAASQSWLIALALARCGMRASGRAPARLDALIILQRPWAARQARGVRDCAVASAGSGLAMLTLVARLRPLPWQLHAVRAGGPRAARG